MTEQDQRLIEILATTDAIWRPLRRADWAPPTPAVLYERRHRFGKVGVPWTTGGGNEGRRKAQQRGVVDLAAVGLLVLCGDSRRSGVRLTEAAEAGFRALCGLPNLDESHAMLRKVISLSAKSDDGQSLCREFWLWGANNYSGSAADAKKAWEVSLILAAALLREWVESRSDCHGRSCYTATDAGRKAAKLSCPTLPEGLPAYSDEANAAYYEATLAARQRLRTATPSNPAEIGECPLSCSLDLRRPTRRRR